jgi:hypothetical protein
MEDMVKFQFHSKPVPQSPQQRAGHYSVYKDIGVGSELMLRFCSEEGSCDVPVVCS